MSSGRNPARLAAILALFEGIADEVVVAVEEPNALATYAAVGHVADHVISFPPGAPADRPIAWLFGACSGAWILNIDDDEVPAPALLEMLPALVARTDITHGWIARRWLYPTTDTYLDQAPWRNEFQLRLFRADGRFLQFSDLFHLPVVASGPAVFVDAPLWHLDTAVNPAWRRRAKADAYERERPGMKIGGRAHNHALYLPELAGDPAVANVPARDVTQIESVLRGDAPATRTMTATLSYASAHDIDEVWPGAPFPETLHRGRISAPAVPHTMTAGVQDTIDVFLTNESGQTWRWGKDARPEIRLAYRWTSGGEPVPEPVALRTALPADLAPGATQLVPLHVVPPPRPGRYVLQFELVHEGVCSFATTLPVELDVLQRDKLAVIGRPAEVGELCLRLGLAPSVEPVVVLAGDGDGRPYGEHAFVPGLRARLLDGLETSGRVAAALRLSWRTLSVARSARRYRRTGTSFDQRLAPLFELLHRSQALVVAGADWPEGAAAGRESWRLAATLRAARQLGCPVFYGEELVAQRPGARNKVLRHLVLRLGRPLAELPVAPVGPGLPAAPAETPEPVPGGAFVAASRRTG